MANVVLVCGALGFVWVPLWWFVSKRVPLGVVAQPMPEREL